MFKKSNAYREETRRLEEPFPPKAEILSSMAENQPKRRRSEDIKQALKESIMRRFDIRICEKDDVAALTAFLRENWDTNHIMANSPEYLDCFFYDKRTKGYNILLALEEETDKIAGFIAFVPASVYDNEIRPEHDFVWVTNWLANESAKGAGLSLYTEMLRTVKCGGTGTLGQNETAEAIYRKLGYKIGALSQYYMLSRDTGRGKAATGGFGVSPSGAAQLKEIERHNAQIPRKTAAYIENKYLKSPYYMYYTYVLGRGAVIFKVQEYPKEYCKRCIRIVEYFGDLSALSGKETEFRALMSGFGADYIDFYCAGLPEELLQSAGFEKNEGQTLLPNYFEPFVNKNIEIRYAYKMSGEKDGFTVYKGDCDREFPRVYQSQPSLTSP